MAYDKSWLHQVWRRFQWSSTKKSFTRHGASRWRIKEAVKTRSERLIAWLKNCPSQHYGHQAQIPDLFKRRDATLLALSHSRLRIKNPPPAFHHDLLDAAATLGALEVRLGYKFKNRMTGIEALKVSGDIHSLYYDGTVYQTGKNNRLALLGDRVLSLALCEIWFQTDHTNGDHARMSSQTVSRAALAVTGQRLGLEQSILKFSGTLVTKGDIAETFEALLGAVYVDSGNDMNVIKRVLRAQKVDHHRYLKTREEWQALYAMEVVPAWVAPVEQRKSANLDELVAREKAAIPDIHKVPSGQTSTLSSRTQMIIAKEEQNEIANLVRKVRGAGDKNRAVLRFLKKTMKSKRSEQSVNARLALRVYFRLLKAKETSDPMAIYRNFQSDAHARHAESEKDAKRAQEQELWEDSKNILSSGVNNETPISPRGLRIRRSGGFKRSDQLQSPATLSQKGEFGQDASESPEQGLEEAEAEEAAAHTTPHERSSTRISYIKSGPAKPDTEQLEQTAVASDVDASATLDSAATPESSLASTPDQPTKDTKPAEQPGRHTAKAADMTIEKSFSETDMDPLFNGLVYKDAFDTVLNTDDEWDHFSAFQKDLIAKLKTGTELLLLHKEIYQHLAESAMEVAGIKYWVRLRIRMASSRTGVKTFPVHQEKITSPMRSRVRLIMKETMITAMEEGLRFGTTEWNIFVRDSLGREATVVRLAAEEELRKENALRETERLAARAQKKKEKAERRLLRDQERNLRRQRRRDVLAGRLESDNKSLDEEEAAPNTRTELVVVEEQDKPEGPTIEVPEQTPGGRDQAVVAKKKGVSKPQVKAQEPPTKKTEVLDQLQDILSRNNSKGWRRMHLDLPSMDRMSLQTRTELELITELHDSLGSAAAPPETWKAPSGAARRRRGRPTKVLRFVHSGVEVSQPKV